MIKIDLAAATRRAKKTRKTAVVIRDIPVPSMFAGDLYRAAYAPVVALWTKAIDGLMLQYTRTLAEGTFDSATDVNAELNEVERQFNVLSLILTPALESWALRIERWQRDKWSKAVLLSTNVDISQVIGPQAARKTVEQTIAWNIDLIKDINADTRKKMANIVYSGMRESKPAREVAKELRAVAGFSKKRSILVAADQLSKITSTLADERRREVGINLWKWLHSGKLRPRKEHKARDGFIYSDDPKDVGTTVEGQTVKAPPADRVGQLPWCGCRSQSVLTF